MTDHSETGPMTASEDAALEAARRATGAQHPWWLSQDAQGTPVYFVREPSDMGAWREATQEAFEYFPEKYRRVLYTRPATQPVGREALDERTKAEHVYSTTAFNFAADPIGSRDWSLFWDGWRLRAALGITGVGAAP